MSQKMEKWPMCNLKELAAKFFCSICDLKITLRRGEPLNSRCDTTVLPQLCPGVKFARFGHSEDAPKTRGDLRTSMEPPANFAPDYVGPVHLMGGPILMN